MEPENGKTHPMLVQLLGNYSVVDSDDSLGVVVVDSFARCCFVL